MEKLIAQFKALPAWQRAFLIAGLPLILSIYLYMMLLSPAIDERDRLQRDVENLRGEIQSLRASLSPNVLEDLRKQQEELEQEYLRKSQEIKNLVGEMPTERDTGKVLRNIGNIARKNKTVILSMQISNPEKVQYYMEGEKNLVKVYNQQQIQQQTQQQTQQQLQSPPQGITLLKSELRLTILGDYRSIRSFLEGLRKEGIISYPVEINLTSEGSRIRADLLLHILFREEAKL
ncbi:MAG: hypothetical protein ACK4MW_03930 [Aquificaceae bacterium]